MVRALTMLRIRKNRSIPNLLNVLALRQTSLSELQIPSDRSIPQRWNCAAVMDAQPNGAMASQVSQNDASRGI